MNYLRNTYITSTWNISAFANTRDANANTKECFPLTIKEVILKYLPKNYLHICRLRNFYHGRFNLHLHNPYFTSHVFTCAQHITSSALRQRHSFLAAFSAANFVICVGHKNRCDFSPNSNFNTFLRCVLCPLQCYFP